MFRKGIILIMSKTKQEKQAERALKNEVKRRAERDKRLAEKRRLEDKRKDSFDADEKLDSIEQASRIFEEDARLKQEEEEEKKKKGAFFFWLGKNKVVVRAVSLLAVAGLAVGGYFVVKSNNNDKNPVESDPAITDNVGPTDSPNPTGTPDVTASPTSTPNATPSVDPSVEPTVEPSAAPTGGPVVTPPPIGSKPPIIHVHSFGEWYDNGLSEARRCACGEVEYRAHSFENWFCFDDTLEASDCATCDHREYREHDKTEHITYDKSARDGFHIKKTTIDCSTCDYLKTKSVSESCEFHVKSYTSQEETLECEKCGDTKTRGHKMNNGVYDGDYIVYSCEHDGCNYKRFERVNEVTPSAEPSAPVVTPPPSPSPEPTDPGRNENQNDDKDNPGIGSGDKKPFDDSELDASPEPEPSISLEPEQSDTNRNENQNDGNLNQGIGDGGKKEFSAATRVEKINILQQIKGFLIAQKGQEKKPDADKIIRL